MDCSRCESNPKIRTKPAAVVGELCEGCYLYTYVVPLQKERENSEKIVNDLTRQIQYRLAELHKAKHVDQLSSEEASRRMLERQKSVQRGELVALGYQYCAKCHAPFELAIERIMHEEDCRVVNYGKRRDGSNKGGHHDNRAGKAGPIRETREVTDLEEMA